MKIRITETPDVNIENIDLAKVKLTDKIVEKVKPLFDEVLTGKGNQIKELLEEYNYKRDKVKLNKVKLQEKLGELNRRKKNKKANWTSWKISWFRFIIRAKYKKRNDSYIEGHQ